MICDSVILTIATCLGAYTTVALVVFYALNRTGAFGDSYDSDLDRAMSSAFWPAAAPVCFIIFLFILAGELGRRRRESVRRKRNRD